MALRIEHFSALLACMMIGIGCGGVEPGAVSGPPSIDGGAPAAATDSAEGADAALDTGRTITAKSIGELHDELGEATSGDTIVLADGKYADATIAIARSGVTVRSETPGGVTFTGASSVVITGDRVRLSGFQFVGGGVSGRPVIDLQGDHDVVEQLNIKGYVAKTWIHIAAGTRFNEISRCNVEAKPTTASILGAIVQVNTSPTVVGYHKIRHCSFRHLEGPSGDFGNEPIRIGLSTEKENVSRTVVEHCVFDDVGGADNESISVKSTENVCRFNTFTNNPQGMLVFRHGNRNQAYGNFFINGSGGIRIKEGNGHFVHDNYFSTGAADAVVLTFVPEAPLDGITFLHNTFVDGGRLTLGKSGPKNVTFANNLLTRTSGTIFGDATGSERWIGNLYAGDTGLTARDGLREVAPGLQMNADGYYGLSATSPAIDAARGGYPAIPAIAGLDNDSSLLFDIGGQPRPSSESAKDVGCDEYDPSPAKLRPLSLEDVGPSYLAPK